MDNQIILNQIYDKLMSMDTRLKNLEDAPNHYFSTNKNHTDENDLNINNKTRTFYNRNSTSNMNYRDRNTQPSDDSTSSQNKQVQSENPQFRSLSKSLFQYVQIRRCTKMWDTALVFLSLLFITLTLFIACSCAIVVKSVFRSSFADCNFIFSPSSGIGNCIMLNRLSVAVSRGLGKLSHIFVQRRICTY